MWISREYPILDAFIALCKFNTCRRSIVLKKNINRNTILVINCLGLSLQRLLMEKRAANLPDFMKFKKSTQTTIHKHSLVDLVIDIHIYKYRIQAINV